LAHHLRQPHHSKVAIISEFYSDGTLIQYVLNPNQLDEAEGAGIFRQLCGAVYCLHHTLGVVHTYENNDIKLADFGIAGHISQAQTSTSFYGTKPYSAAQLVQQKPYNPHAADCYASRVVTMLCGKWPHVSLLF
jgi:serine/threonine protein kinase